MTAGDLLTACDAAGIHLEVRGGQLHVEAPAGAVTPALREALRRHKADLLTRLAPVAPEMVTLKGGLVVPLPALQLALALEGQGFPAALTEADRAGIRRWRLHLAALVDYRCPLKEFPQ